MFVGSFKKKIKINGYIQNNLIEPLSLPKRHDVLAWELIRRSLLRGDRYKEHKSPIIQGDEYLNLISYLPEEQINYKINQESSINDLLNRCIDCRNRYLLAINYNLDIFNIYYLPPEINSFEGL